MKADLSGTTQSTELEINFETSRIGKKVINFEDVSFAFPDKRILTDFNLLVQNKDRIGIVGDNGVGKSTLLNLINGDLKPSSGKLEIGETVRISYFSQLPKDMDEDKRVINYLQEVADEVKTSVGTTSVTDLLEQFLFPRSTHGTLISKLSGGEKKRLYLLKILIEKPNVLLLDEPTNGLDITSRQALKRIISRSMDDESTLLISTHQAHDFENLLDHLVILGKGEILLNRSLDEISNRLLFARTDILPAESIYSEQDLSGHFSILPNEDGEENTPDIELLYKAVLQQPEKIQSMFQ